MAMLTAISNSPGAPGIPACKGKTSGRWVSEHGGCTMVTIDPLLLLLFLPKTILGLELFCCSSSNNKAATTECAQIVPGTGGGQNGVGRGSPFKSVFSVLFPSLFPSSSLY